MKKYIAKTHVSINIVLASGANRHIAFDAVTGGGSVFYTDDEVIQKALESHYKFGKLFQIDKDFNKEQKQLESDEETAVDEDGPGTESNDSSELQPVVVTDVDAAKTYLAEHFGISRTKLKTVSKIIAEAAANGIVFEGI
jgi:hypothetical protein